LKPRLHPLAAKDLHDAAAFYEQEVSQALAARFLAEFARVARLLAEHPGLGTPRGDSRRGFPMKGFPYTLIYRADEAGLLVLVVKHQRRRPGYGGARR
jgi:toxin ParE1/3/4